jgi:hypothetical protein
MFDIGYILKLFAQQVSRFAAWAAMSHSAQRAIISNH